MKISKAKVKIKIAFSSIFYFCSPIRFSSTLFVVVVATSYTLDFPAPPGTPTTTSRL
jgi:hypothetical protein